MNNKENLKNVIKMINTGKKYPALQLVKQNPEAAAVISKLVKPRDKSDFDVAKPDTYYNLNQSQIQNISDKTKSRIKDNENILQLFPDIELAAQILISSILSPKDMVKTEIIYKAKETILPAELSMKLNAEFQKHIEGHYGILDDVQQVLRDTLFDKGSHIKAVIPESIVDEIINSNIRVSNEALTDLFTDKGTSKHLGILGNSGELPPRTALERFSLTGYEREYDGNIANKNALDIFKALKISKEHLDITDNYKLLKLPEVVNSANRQRLKHIINPNKISTEAYGANNEKLTNAQLSGLMYKEAKGETQSFMVIPSIANSKRKSIGRPLVLNLPPESVIPIYIPGDETKHIGYFVLTDADGNPVTTNSSQDNLEGLSSLMRNQNQNQGLSSVLINKAKRNLIDSSNDITIDGITKIYTSIVEKDLVERLRNGLYGTEMSVGNNEEVYRIMLARAIASKYTRLIFVPGELVTYFAFKYFSNGVGKSYLDDIKVLSSLRAIMLFSKVMALTKNSINLTNVNMTLDEQDPDPQKTIETAIHEIIKMRQQYFPLGINSPVDLVDWIQRAGFEFTFEGHPGLPQTKFDFETKNLQHTLPDSDLDELLRKQTYMAFGLSPEVVDNGFSSEFATTVISNNILLSKRVLQLQTIFTRQLTDYAHKLALNDTFILTDLKEVLKAHKGLVEKSLSNEEKTIYTQDEDRFLNDLIERYIDNLVLDLPKPDITSMETQMAAFDQYVEGLEKTLDSWVNADFLSSDLIGELNSNVESIKAVVKHHFIRKWMADNGFMNELNDIITADEDGKPNMDLYEIAKNHTEGVARASLNYIKSLQNLKIASNKDLENMNVEPGEEPTGDDEGGFGGEQDTGGEGDFDMGEMEAPPEEEEAPPAEEEKPDTEVGL